MEGDSIRRGAREQPEPPRWQNEEIMFCPVCRKRHDLASSVCARCGRPLVRKTVRVRLDLE